MGHNKVFFCKVIFLFVYYNTLFLVSNFVFFFSICINGSYRDTYIMGPAIAGGQKILFEMFVENKG